MVQLGPVATRSTQSPKHSIRERERGRVSKLAGQDGDMSRRAKQASIAGMRGLHTVTLTGL